MGFIHMNGRVYDPSIGRFLSADPNIQAPYGNGVNRAKVIVVEIAGFVRDGWCACFFEC
jgi:hypothetical protein